MQTGITGQRIGLHTRQATLSTVYTVTQLAGATFMMLQPFTQNVYVTYDNTTPSATNGFELTAGQLHRVDFGIDTVIKVIEKTASASIQYQQFAERRVNNL